MRLFLVRRAGIELDFDAAESPAPAVRGRAAHLQQAVLNLIMNSEQALAGQLGGTIAIMLSEEAGQAVLRTIDNGPGPDAVLGERVFDAFVTTRPRTESPGLGLAAARIIARAHGGDVTLEDCKPGCCAMLRLPLGEASEAQRLRE
jgi:signal transduction histidine kinase